MTIVPLQSLKWSHPKLAASLTFQASLHPLRAAYSHPAVVLLLKGLQSWRASLGPDTPSDRIPANSQERTAFKKLLSSMRKHVDDGVALDVSCCPLPSCGYQTALRC